MQNGEKNCQHSNRSDEQEQFKKPEHKLEIRTKFLSSHGYHLKKDPDQQLNKGSSILKNLKKRVTRCTPKQVQAIVDQ
jgi:hypothetical protein